MTSFLTKLFIKNRNDIKNQRVRTSYGVLGSIVGIIANLLLFIGKIIVGLIGASVSIIADAVNNLSDCGSQIITLAGFTLAGKEADKKHPFGHQRVEYIAAMCVAFIIFVLAVQLVISSIKKIITPSPVTFNVTTGIVLGVAILIKLWLFLFNRKLGKTINSDALKATSIDSLSDVMATSAVLISGLIGYFFPTVNLDGYIGIAVALFITFGGITILKDTLSKLLGGAPSHELVQFVENKIKSFEKVLDCHDLIIHNYGENKIFASVHIEVDSKLEFSVGHDLSDIIERSFIQQDNIHLVVHLDPVNTDDSFTKEMKDKVKAIALAKELKIHDFRTVKGNTHSNLIFDLAVPFGYPMTDLELKAYFVSKIKEIDINLYAVISIDYVVPLE